MPTYEYECKHCGNELEALQAMSDAPLTRCPKCRRKGLKRLISLGAGIIFRGSGFYATDYKRGSAENSGPKSSESKEAESGSDSSTE